LRRDEFHLEYQPVFYTRTRQCVGLEVMLRWRNTVHGIRGAEWYMEQLERTVVGDGILDFKFDAAAAELAGLEDSASMYVIVDVPGSLLESQASLDRLIRMAKQLTPVCKLVLQFPLDDVAGRLAEIAQLRAAQIRVGVSHVHGASPALDALAGAGIEFLKADREVMSLEEDERAQRLRALASDSQWPWWSMASKAPASIRRSAARTSISRRGSIWAKRSARRACRRSSSRSAMRKAMSRRVSCTRSTPIEAACRARSAAPIRPMRSSGSRGELCDALRIARKPLSQKETSMAAGTIGALFAATVTA
jgi:EAL domain-containing protein (putative c-di-GMP-specific phosphodiesterase class I)